MEQCMSSTEEVLNHHLQAFGATDLEAVLADYAPDAIFFTPNGPVKGSAAIRAAFIAIFAEWGKPGTTFSMGQRHIDGDYAYITWTGETADNRYETSSDGFVIRNGKIFAQFFAGKITPKR
jgi:ketosteroid isomerase-like protein